MLAERIQQLQEAMAFSQQQMAQCLDPGRRQAAGDPVMTDSFADPMHQPVSMRTAGDGHQPGNVAVRATESQDDVARLPHEQNFPPELPSSVADHGQHMVAELPEQPPGRSPARQHLGQLPERLWSGQLLAGLLSRQLPDQAPIESRTLSERVALDPGDMRAGTSPHAERAPLTQAAMMDAQLGLASCEEQSQASQLHAPRQLGDDDSNEDTEEVVRRAYMAEALGIPSFSQASTLLQSKQICHLAVCACLTICHSLMAQLHSFQ